jgi:HlyD family secretion protein
MKRRTVSRIIGVIVVVAVIVAAGVFFVRRRAAAAASPTAVQTVTVTQGRIEETIGASGNVAASQQVNLSFGASGTVAQVAVTAGQQVKAGQVLAQLDTTNLGLQVQNAQASLDAAQANLQQAQQPASAEDMASAQAALASAQANYDSVKAGPSKADVAAAKAAVASAQANYNSVKAGPTADSLAAAKAALDNALASLQQAQSAYDQVKDRPNVGQLSQSLTLQQATNAYDEAKANYDAAKNHPTPSELAAADSQLASARYSLAQLQEQPTQAQLTSAEAQVASAQYQLSQLQAQPSAEAVASAEAAVKQAQLALTQAQEQLAGATITTPADSMVITVNIQQGDTVASGTPAIVLVPDIPPVVDANVDEVDVASLAVGQTVHLGFNALPGRTITGTVTAIAPTSTSVSGAVAYQVQIGFTPGRLPVRLGMTANVAIVIASADPALLVPSQAITVDRQANKYYVTSQLADGTVQRLEVRIGLHNDTETQIVQGVKAGDKLVLPQVPGTTTTTSSSSTNFRGLGGLGGGGGRPAGSGGAGGGN